MTKRKSPTDWKLPLVAENEVDLQQFRPLPGTANEYLVRRDGNDVLTRSRKTPSGYYLRVAINKGRNGYRRATICFTNRRIKGVQMGRLVLSAWVSEPPSSEHVAAHKDGESDNDHLDNLEWAIPLEVKSKSIARGTWAHGDQIHTARLKPSQVTAIRKAHSEHGVSHSLLAQILDMHQPRISEVFSKSWKTQEQSLQESQQRIETRYNG